MDFFAEEKPVAPAHGPSKADKNWCVLLVDDEPEVHKVTSVVMRSFEFQGRGLEFVHAYSAAEAAKLFQSRSDIAMALVDVVMESEHAGLDLVHDVRKTMGNHLTRLVLRTGQAGQAPEERVIRDYDIDDYKEKTELSTRKMRTLFYSMLRSYRDICLIQAQRDGLRRVLDAIPKIQTASTLHLFASTVLEQLTSLLGLGSSALYCVVMPTGDGSNGQIETRTMAATGEFINYQIGKPFTDFPEKIAGYLREALTTKNSMHYPDAYVHFMPGHDESVNLMLVSEHGALDELDAQFLEVFMHNVAVTFQNLGLMEDLQGTARDLVYMLTGAVEARSKESGAHVKRVALMSERLAVLAEVPAHEAEMIKMASPLHDVGKIAIPDSILHKPGKLTPEEWQVMKRHVEFGVQMLQGSHRPIIRKAAEIAGYHHEKWDGSGYPNGLAGNSIPISGRITALVDVFDALMSKRSYKEPWPLDRVAATITEDQGRHFDPLLTELFLKHLDDFVVIYEAHPDIVAA